VLKKIRFITDTTIPWFLPANAGGLGLPVESIPSWGWKYISYILEVSELEPLSRISVMYDLRQLGGRSKRGLKVSDKTLNIIHSVLSDFQAASPDEDFSGRLNTLYSESTITRWLRSQGYLVRDWDDTVRIAQTLGILPLDTFISRVENSLQINEALQNPAEVRENRSLVRWVRRSSRFWKKVNLREVEGPDPRFKGLGDLQKTCARMTGYYVVENTSIPFVRYGTKLLFNSRLTSKVPGKWTCKDRIPLPTFVGR
jgi:hypothetical protein